MRRIYIILILSIFISEVCFSQELTQQEYRQLSGLFNKIDHSVPPDTYLSKKIKLAGIYSDSTVLELPEMPDLVTTIDKILIIVHSSIFSQVEDKIKRYALDINNVYGCAIKMDIVSNAEYTDIKFLILSELTDLDGVVLIGDLPAAWYEVSNDYDTYGHAEWPCDLYYMDTDGVWGDSDLDEIYDSHTGNVQPEIFVGRISTANMGTLISEKTGLENYLDKDHQFWNGQLTVNRKFGLSYTDADWDDISYFKTDIQYLYGSENYDGFLYKDYPSYGKTDYLSRLSNDRYEFIQLSCHSSYNYHYMAGSSYIYGNEIFNSETEAIGYNLFCCSGCRWTSVSSSSPYGYLAGAYIYNNNTSGLVVIGSTKTGSMLVFSQYYQPLGAGKTVGEAFVSWWVNGCGTSHSSYEVYWHYGMSVIGDPMINFFQVQDGCHEYLNLTDTIDGGTYEFLVSDSITASNLISNGATVHYGSNGLLRLLPGFKAESGCSFIADTIGCSMETLKSTIVSNNSVSQLNEKKGNLETLQALSDKEFKGTDIKIFPNPMSNGSVQIEMMNSEKPNRILVYNTMGQVVYNNSNPDMITQIDNIHEKGLLFIQINLPESIVVKKINSY
jgi:hypothetical protein